MTYRVLDLFSGIGGFSLGLERTGGFKTVAFCEIDPFCRKVLAKHWPDVPCHDDVETREFEEGEADVITGGFPCQPFSTASRGRRVEISLWPAMLRAILHVRPKYIIAENVSEVAIKWSEHTLNGYNGYRTIRKRISGIDAGADHQRHRWWLIAHTNDKSKLSKCINEKMGLLPEICLDLWGRENYARAIRVSNGLPYRMDRIKALGNTVIPQIPEMIGRAILEAEAK